MAPRVRLRRGPSWKVQRPPRGRGFAQALGAVPAEGAPVPAPGEPSAQASPVAAQAAAQAAAAGLGAGEPPTQTVGAGAPETPGWKIPWWGWLLGAGLGLGIPGWLWSSYKQRRQREDLLGAWNEILKAWKPQPTTQEILLRMMEQAMPPAPPPGGQPPVPPPGQPPDEAGWRI